MSETNNPGDEPATPQSDTPEVPTSSETAHQASEEAQQASETAELASTQAAEEQTASEPVAEEPASDEEVAAQEVAAAEEEAAAEPDDHEQVAVEAEIEAAPQDRPEPNEAGAPVENEVLAESKPDELADLMKEQQEAAANVENPDPEGGPQEGDPTTITALNEERVGDATDAAIAVEEERAEEARDLGEPEPTGEEGVVVSPVASEPVVSVDMQPGGTVQQEELPGVDAPTDVAIESVPEEFVQATQPETALEVGVSGGETLAELADRAAKALALHTSIVDSSQQGVVEEEPERLSKDELFEGLEHGSIDPDEDEELVVNSLVNLDAISLTQLLEQQNEQDEPSETIVTHVERLLRFSVSHSNDEGVPGLENLPQRPESLDDPNQDVDVVEVRAYYEEIITQVRKFHEDPTIGDPTLSVQNGPYVESRNDEQAAQEQEGKVQSDQE